MNSLALTARRWAVIVASVALSLLPGGNAGGGAIVNNEGNTGEDSVTVSVINWDSAGCSPISADSFWVVIFKSAVDAPIFIDSGTTSMTGLDTVRAAGATAYYYHRAIADIDGDGVPGCYSGEVIAKNTTMGLFSSAAFEFQVVGWELDDLGDSAAFAATLFDSLLAKGELLDSVYALLDSLQNQDDWISTFDPSSDAVMVSAEEFGEMADTIFGRDSGLFDEGYWHKLASRADSGAVGSDVDSASVAGWIWNTPQSNHIVEGTFGKYLDSEVSGIGIGSGVLSHSIVAYDSSAGQVIPGATVVIRNLDQTSLMAVGATGSDGTVSFNLDAGDYLAVASARAYLFDTYKTITVASGEADTVYGALFDPGAPVSPDLCRVYGFIFDLAGEPETGVTISAALPSGVVKSDGLIVSPGNVSTVTDSEGYFYLDLIPSEKMTPSGTQYEFTIIRPDGAILRQRLTVPDEYNWQLTW